LPHILAAVAPLLARDPQLVGRGASIIHNICLYYDDDDDDEAEGPTNELSPYYSGIVSGLLTSIDRRDVPDQIRHDVQEALNRLFGAAAPDCFGVLYDLVPTMIGRLRAASEATRQTTGSAADLEATQGLIVASINHIARRIKRQMVPVLGDVVEALTFMFQCAREGAVLAEGIMCIGALSLATKEAFAPYLEAIHPFIQAAITTLDDYDLCSSGIATISDLAAGCERLVEPMLPETLSNLLTALQNPDCDPDLKSLIISCLGDIALNAGGELFQPYLDAFMAAVQAIDVASRQEQLEAGRDANSDEYIGGLWEHMLSFGTSVVQGFAENLEPILGYLDYFLDFAMHAAQHMDDDEDVIKGCATLLGDMANTLRHGPPQYWPAARDKLCTTQVMTIIQQALKWDDDFVRDSADWANKELQHLSNTR
jgi:hypothetical protein